jgi:hypothetical protein
VLGLEGGGVPGAGASLPGGPILIPQVCVVGRVCNLGFALGGIDPTVDTAIAVEGYNQVFGKVRPRSGAWWAGGG